MSQSRPNVGEMQAEFDISLLHLTIHMNLFTNYRTMWNCLLISGLLSLESVALRVVLFL